MGERLPCKQEVTSSNLVFSTQIMKRADGVGRQDFEPGLPERRRLYDNRRIFEEYPWLRNNVLKSHMRTRLFALLLLIYMYIENCIQRKSILKYIEKDIRGDCYS